MSKRRQESQPSPATPTPNLTTTGADPLPRGLWPLWPKVQWLLRRRREFIKRHRKAIIWGQVGFVAFAIFLMIVGMHLFAPDLRKYEQRSPVLFDAQGNVLYSAMTQDDYYRIATTVKDVDPLYLKMLLAAEDERFYHHWGVDSFAIVRAMMHNVQAGEIVSGASTLTMQVCRLLEPKERTIFNKVKESLGALNLTYYQGREQVLNMYLTLAPFGGNIEGVTAASYMYFGHSPKHLSPDEAALLVALPRAPEGMRPDRHPDIARYYRHQVLAKAYADQLIAQDVMEAADQEPLPRQRLPLPQDAYHLGQSLFLGKLQTPERARLYPVSAVSAIAPKLHPTPTADTTADTAATTTASTTITAPAPAGTSTATAPSSAAHATANFVIERQQPTELYSTIDPVVQKRLNQIAQDYFASLTPTQQDLKQESIAILAVDNRNFKVLGYVGSPYIKLSYVDAVQALRSPGSALKPFAYALAFAQNLLHPHSLLLDTAHVYGSYQPQNYDRRFFGEINAAQALQASLNLPAIEIMKAIGPVNFLNHLNQFANAQDVSSHQGERDSYTHGRIHLAANTTPHLGVILGAAEISLYDLTQLYTALAHDGKIAPLTILRPAPTSQHNHTANGGSTSSEGHTSSEGNTKATSKNNTKEAATNETLPASTLGPFLPEDAARATYLILEGTPTPLGYQQPTIPISYKTGTSHKYRDTVAIGSSGGITVGIWTGRLDGKPRSAFSSFELVAPLLFKTMANLPTIPLNKPALPPSPLLSPMPPVALARISIAKLGQVQKRGFYEQNQSANTIARLGSLNPTNNHDSTNSHDGDDSYNYDNVEPIPATHSPLQIQFPQNNTHLQVGMSGQVMINFSGGQAPYYVLVNDQLQNQSNYFSPQHNGIHFITVIDSLGNSVTSQIFVQGVMENANETFDDSPAPELTPDHGTIPDVPVKV